MSLPLDRKYYAKEPAPSFVPDPRLHESKKQFIKSSRNFQETRRRLSILKGENTYASINQVVEQKPEKKQERKVPVAASDDDVDVWNRGLRSNLSVGDFTVVSDGEDYEEEHPVPCGDPNCDRCDILSVVSDFDEDEPSVLLQPATGSTVKRSLSHTRTETTKSQQSAGQSKKPEKPVLKIPSQQPTDSHGVDAESVIKVHETRPVKIERVGSSQAALDAYMKSYTKQRRSAQRGNTDERKHEKFPEPEYIQDAQESSPKRTLMREAPVKSPIDRLVDTLKYSPLVADARGRRLSTSQLRVFDAPQIDSASHTVILREQFSGPRTEVPVPSQAHVPHSAVIERSPEVAVTKETGKPNLIKRVDSLRRTSSVRRSNSRASSSGRVNKGPVPHPLPDLPQEAPHPLPKVPIDRSNSFTGRMAKLDLGVERAPSVFAKKSFNTDDEGPRFGRGSRPPVSYRATGI